MSSRGIRLSATVPVNLLSALSLQPGRTYTVQLTEGESARLFTSGSPDASAPDPAVVDPDDLPVAGTVGPRPIRVANNGSAEITPGQGPYYYATWAWDPGEGMLAVVSVF